MSHVFSEEELKDPLNQKLKKYIEAHRALCSCETHEEYVAMKEKYRDFIPEMHQLFMDGYYFHAADDNELYQEIMQDVDYHAISHHTSQYDGEKYFDPIAEERFKQVAAGHKTPETIEEANTHVPVYSTVDRSLVQAYQTLFDEINIATEEYRSYTEASSRSGVERAGVYSELSEFSLQSVLMSAAQRGDRETYMKVYADMARFNERFTELGLGGQHYADFNLAPSRSSFFPLEFKDNYAASAIYREAQLYRQFKELTGKSLVDVYDRKLKLTEEMFTSKPFTMAFGEVLQGSTSAQQLEVILSADARRNVCLEAAKSYKAISMPASLIPLMGGLDNITADQVSYYNSFDSLSKSTIGLQFRIMEMKEVDILKNILMNGGDLSPDVALGYKEEGTELKELPTAAELAASGDKLAELLSSCNSNIVDGTRLAASIPGVVKELQEHVAMEMKTRRTQALAETKQVIAITAAETKSDARLAKAVQKYNKKNFKAYMKDLKKTDPDTYKKIVAENKRYARENKVLDRLNRAQLKALRALDKYETLEKAHVLTEREKAAYAKAQEKQKKALNAYYAKLDEMEKSNKSRCNEREISAEQRDLRESQINSGDFTYSIMCDQAHANAAKQVSKGTIARLPDLLKSETDPKEKERLAALTAETDYLRSMQKEQVSTTDKAPAPAPEPAAKTHDVTGPAREKIEEPKRERVDLKKAGITVRKQSDRQTTAPQKTVEPPTRHRDVIGD